MTKRSERKRNGICSKTEATGQAFACPKCYLLWAQIFE